MANEPNKEVTPQKDGLALVVGGLFILALVFAAYNYFSKGTNVEDTSVTTDKSDQGVVVQKDKDKDKDAESNKQPENNQEGSVNGDGAKDVKKDEIVAGSKTEETSKETAQLSWAATDYKSGEIKSGNYTVKSGDTLWELSEGLYGNGSEWTKILDANKGTVGFLASGSQALIVPGQVLVLP
jgi:nucleoid-associated protein YgaU